MAWWVSSVYPMSIKNCWISILYNLTTVKKQKKCWISMLYNLTTVKKRLHLQLSATSAENIILQYRSCCSASKASERNSRLCFWVSLLFSVHLHLFYQLFGCVRSQDSELFLFLIISTPATASFYIFFIYKSKANKVGLIAKPSH